MKGKLFTKILLSFFVPAVISSVIIALLVLVYELIKGGFIIKGFWSAWDFVCINAIFNMAFFLVCIVAYAGLVILANKLLKRHLISDNRIGIINGNISGVIFCVMIIVIVNIDHLGILFTPTSIIYNAVMAILSILVIVLFGFLGGLLGRKLKDKRILGILTPVSIGILLVCIADIVFYEDYTIEDNNNIVNGPNVIIITCDALRRDHISCYDKRYVETPNIDLLASKGYVFDNSFTNSPWTIPSMMTLNTGHYPSVHKAAFFIAAPNDMETLPGRLKSYGYRTEAFVGNPVLYSEYGFKKGYDAYVEYGDFRSLLRYKKSVLYRFIKRVRDSIGQRLKIGFDITRWCENQLVDSFDRNYGKRPFFVWVHILDPHAPLTPPIKYIEGDDEFIEEAVIFGQLNTANPESFIEEKINIYTELYEAETRYIDDIIGEIFATMDKYDAWDDTIVIFSSDHGEEFFEHGRYGHGMTHYHEVTAVPLIIYLPDYPGNIAIDTPASIIDIPATILDYLGLEPLQDSPGISLMSDIEGKPNPDKVVFTDRTGTDNNMISVNDGNYLLIRKGQTDFSYELYNSSEDKLAENDLYNNPDYLKIRRRLSNKIKEEKKTIDDISKLYQESEKIKLSEDQKEKLKGLGYLQ